MSAPEAHSTELVAGLRAACKSGRGNYGHRLLCGQAADEIERLQLLVADYGGQLAALTARAVDVPAPPKACECLFGAAGEHSLNCPVRTDPKD